MDTIALNGISCEANIGSTPKRRSQPQTLMIDVLVSLDLDAASNQDELELTVDYETLLRKVQKLISDHEFNLLEAVAGRLCRAILAMGPIDSVRVTVRKFPEELRDALDHVVVDMTRS